jgi:hypothetical protein
MAGLRNAATPFYSHRNLALREMYEVIRGDAHIKILLLDRSRKGKLF